MANFSSRKSRSHSGAVMVTVLVAIQTVLPLHSRWTSRRWVMGSSGEAARVRGDVRAWMVLMLMARAKKALQEVVEN